MDVADFDFELPEELIAQDPPPERDGARLLVLNRQTGAVQDSTVREVGSHLRSGDVLVLNNTRVFPARLFGRRDPSGGGVECLLIAKLPNAADGPCERWEALMHPGQKLKPGAHVVFEAAGVTLHGEVLAQHFYGRRTVRLWTDDELSVSAAIDRLGHIPLPPYIKREDRPADHDRYQTVYARDRGSIAAPTAGLHFTNAVLEDLASKGVATVEITLHVGYGTFKPVRAARAEDHVVDPETMTVGPETADTLTRAIRERRRVIAVGTTATRALESLKYEHGIVHPSTGETSLFIMPGHQFRIIGGLITNFHLPRSSLLMLVAAFAGRENVLAAYRYAVNNRYRFYSYGDAMLIV